MSIGTTVFGANIARLNSANAGSSAIVLSKSSDDVRLYQNVLRVEGSSTIATCFQAGPDSRSWTNRGNSTNWRIRNNIMERPATGNGSIYKIIAGCTTTAAWTSDNWLYSVNPSNIGGGTLAAWQASGYDLTSISASVVPGLVNDTAPTTAADFAPLPTSPVVGIGTDLRSELPIDYSSVPFLPAATVGAYSWFTGEFSVRATGASNVYAMLLNSTGRVWNGTAFEQYQTSRLAFYARGLARDGSSGRWRGNMPVVPAGRYFVDYRVRADATPAESDAAISDPLSKTTLVWNGTVEVAPAALGRLQATV